RSTVPLTFLPSVHPSPDLTDLHSFPTRRSSDLIEQFTIDFPLSSFSSSFHCFTLLNEVKVRDDLPMIWPTSLHRHIPNRRRQAKDRKSTRLNSSHVSISYAVFS